MIKLKPCPFCGEIPTIDKCINDDGVSVKYRIKHNCKLLHCSMSTFLHKDLSKVVDRWNTRKGWEGEHLSDKVNVKVKKLHPDAVIPKYAHEGDAGFDLVAVEDTVIEPGETKLVPLGLAFEIPQGYEIQIRPRSGLSLKTKLRQSNCVGTIDAGYRGEVKAMFDNTDKDLYTGVIKINKGDRIAQGVLNKVPQAQFIEVYELNESERGEGGFGSSGVRDEN